MRQEAALTSQHARGRGDGAVPPPAVVEAVRSRLTSSGREPTPAHVAAAMREVVGVVGDAEVGDVLGALRSELAGAGPLEPLLRQPAVTDVLVNGPGEVWVDRGRGLERAPVTLADESAAAACPPTA